MSVPFLPFTRPTIDEETIADVGAVLRSGWITSGPKVKEFEAKLSAHCGGRPVRAFNSGTCTMEIALRIAGIGPGHEVITTPLSWVATSNVILTVGARPMFVDVDPVTRNLDLSRVDVTIAYPLLSLGYIVNAVGAWYFLGETMSAQRMLAVGVIIVGVALLARS